MNEFKINTDGPKGQFDIKNKTLDENENRLSNCKNAQ